MNYGTETKTHNIVVFSCYKPNSTSKIKIMDFLIEWAKVIFAGISAGSIVGGILYKYFNEKIDSKIDKHRIASDKEQSEIHEKLELKIEKKIAENRIELQKEILDQRDRTEKFTSELQTQIIGMSNKLDLFYKDTNETVHKNSRSIAVLEQIQLDRDKWNKEVRDEMKTGFTEIREDIKNLREKLNK